MSSINNNKYIFDTSSLSNAFKHYYHDRFPTFWEKFNTLVRENLLISVKEAKNELDRFGFNDSVKLWVKDNRDFFLIPNVEELKFITSIYKINHFQQNLEKKKLLHGGAFADPFIIASAKINNAIVVTEEKFKDHGARIPNICKKFNIKCTNLEGFLIKEGWTF